MRRETRRRVLQAVLREEREERLRAYELRKAALLRRAAQQRINSANGVRKTVTFSETDENAPTSDTGYNHHSLTHFSMLFSLPFWFTY